MCITQLPAESVFEMFDAASQHTNVHKKGTVEVSSRHSIDVVKGLCKTLLETNVLCSSIAVCKQKRSPLNDMY